MSTPLAAGMIVQTRAYCLFGNQLSVNTVHYNILTVGAPPITDADLALALDNSLAADFKALLTNSAQYRGFAVQIIWPLPRRIDVTSAANVGNGTAGTTPIPKQVSGVLSWYTANAGRKYRGRLYSAFPDESKSDTDQTPNSTYVTALDTLGTGYRAMNSLTVSGRTGTMTPVIFHRVKAPGTPTWDPITAQLANKKWGTQRRRGNYGRANNSPV